MSKILSPTITLAKLYETQEQFIDALQIYNKLNLSEPSPELENKINELKELIFSGKKKYHKLIDKIFSLDEKKKFNILSSQQYKEFMESHEEHKELETYPEEMLLKKLEKNGVLSNESEKIIKPEIEKIPVNDTKNIEDEKSNNIDKPEEKAFSSEEITDEEIINEQKIDEENIQDEPKKEIAATTEAVVETEDDEYDLEDLLNMEFGSEKKPEKNKIGKDDRDDFFQEENKIDLSEIPEVEAQKNQVDVINEKIEEKSEEISDEEPLDNSKVDSEKQNTIHNLLQEMQKIDPDKLKEVLSENLGEDFNLHDIKLSDLNFAIELLKSTEE